MTVHDEPTNADGLAPDSSVEALVTATTWGIRGQRRLCSDHHSSYNDCSDDCNTDFRAMRSYESGEVIHGADSRRRDEIYYPTLGTLTGT